MQEHIDTRDIVRTAQAVSFGAECEDELLRAAAEVYLRDWTPADNSAVAANGRNSFALFVPARAL